MIPDSGLLELLFRFQLLLLCGGAVLCLLLESVPATGLARPWRRRWRHVGHNLLLWLLTLLLFNLLLGSQFTPLMPWFTLERIGLLYLVELPVWAHLVLGFLLYDLADYLIHRLSHEVRWLWLLHSVHHADDAMDASTFVRAHPLHFAVTLFWKTLAAGAIGIPYWLVLLRELLAIPVVQLHHAAVRWPRSLERLLRLLIVTPAMHRLHHSPDQRFTDSNYGSLLPWWDMWLGTYSRRSSSDAGRPATTGLTQFPEPRWQTLPGMLLMPWQHRRNRPGEG